MEPIQLSQETFTKILDYLSVQPYREVAELINQAITEARENKAKSETKSE